MARSASIQSPSRYTLEDLPERAVRFLRAVANYEGIQAELGRVGYSKAAHDEGWALLVASCRVDMLALDRGAENRAAFNELAQWVTDNAARYTAAVERLHPEYEGWFTELREASKQHTVIVVDALLGRFRDIEARGKRDAAGSALLETLAQRGLDSLERERLRRLVADAQRPSVGEEPKSPWRHDELLALYAWYRDWSLNARAVIRRKDYLISLGLAERKRAKPKGGEEAR